MLSCRPVQENDIPQICLFPQSAEELFFLFPRASYPLTSDQLKDAIDQRSDSTVVLWNGAIVGFANFYRWGAGGCSIGNVIVSPASRGFGVGRYLIEGMIDIAFSTHRAAEVAVSCFNHNTAGLLLYSKLGFLPFAVEERQNRSGNRVALIHLRLPRNQPERLSVSFDRNSNEPHKNAAG